MAAVCFFIGLYPSPLLKAIEPAADHMLAGYPSAVEASDAATAKVSTEDGTPLTLLMTD